MKNGTKNVRMQVFFDVPTLLEIYSEARANKIQGKNESQLIYNICLHWLHELPLLNIDVQRAKIQIERMKETIEKLQGAKK